MKNFIKIQYRLCILGFQSIGFEKIKSLASKYFSVSEYDEMFNKSEVER